MNDEVFGNKQVIDGIEHLLVRARRGHIRAVGLVCCELQGADVTFLGDERAFAQINFGLDILKQTLINSAVYGKGQDLENRPPANQVTYDLNTDGVCYDFVPWLVTQEMTRRREKSPPPLSVTFTANPHAMTNRSIMRAPFIDGVMRPALELFGAVEGKEGDGGRREDFYSLSEIARNCAAGEEVPQVQVPSHAWDDMRYFLKNRNPVTITLRETAYGEYRNSNLNEWQKLTEWLKRHGEDVIVVRDTAKAREPLWQQETCPQASLDLHIRAALYQQSKCCMFVQNGPFGLACFSKTPWLLFAEVREDHPEHFHRPLAWKQLMGTEVGGQLLWATPQQRIIYKPDTAYNLMEAYEALAL